MNRSALLGVGCLFAVACGSAEPRSGFENGSNANGSPSAPNGSPGQEGPGFENGKAPEEPKPAPPAEPVTVVYGHSASQLYKLDPVTKAVSIVGTFDCSNQITDIAIDGTSKGYAC